MNASDAGAPAAAAPNAALHAAGDGGRAAVLRVQGLGKTFTLHLQGGRRIAVLQGVDLVVHPGECIALLGRSGSGKSSLLRCLYGNYLPTAGSVEVRHAGRWVDLAVVAPRELAEVRRRTIGYVSQFLRAIPRVPALDLVAAPLRRLGVEPAAARARAADWLARLNLPQRLWDLPPATFSGGEQQRVNIARGLIAGLPVLLLDEPTASLDEANRAVVVELIGAARNAGAAVVGIFHDGAVRDAVATRRIDVEQFAQPARKPHDRPDHP